MRTTYAPLSDRAWAQYYATQASQTGGGFEGMRYQRGTGLGSLFRSLFRVLMPVAKTAGRAIGKQALSTGAQIASDVVAGQSIKESAKRRGRAGAAALLKRASRKLQRGKGLGRRRKRATKKRLGKTIKRARKRKAPAKKRGRPKKKKLSDQLGFYYK